MSNCPRLERGAFCILIIILISKNSLVLLSLLRTINYHYNKGLLKVEFIKCKTIQRRLLLILILQSISLKWVIEIVLIFILVISNNKKYIMCYFSLTHNDIIILDMFCIKLSWNFVYLTNIKSVVSWIFVVTIFSKQSKNSIRFNFDRQHTSQKKQIIFTPTQKPPKDGALLRLRRLWYGRSWLRRTLTGFR